MTRFFIARLTSVRFVISVLAVLSQPVLLHAEGKIEARLLFSTDGGVTYTDEQPVVAASKTIHVKTEWKIVGEDRPIKGGVVLTSLRSEEDDFGSANVGNKNWSGVPGWYQRIPTPWLNAKTFEPVVYPLDLAARPEGVAGLNNAWNAGKNSYENGPLPSVAARGAGVHKFIMRLHYAIPDVTEPVVADLPFQVTVTP